jgi:hypothetical protein
MRKIRTKLEPFHLMVLCIFGKYAMTNRIGSVGSLSSKKAAKGIAVDYEYETVGRMWPSSDNFREFCLSQKKILACDCGGSRRSSSDGWSKYQ